MRDAYNKNLNNNLEGFIYEMTYDLSFVRVLTEDEYKKIKK